MIPSCVQPLASGLRVNIIIRINKISWGSHHLAEAFTEQKYPQAGINQHGPIDVKGSAANCTGWGSSLLRLRVVFPNPNLLF